MKSISPALFLCFLCLCTGFFITPLQAKPQEVSSSPSLTIYNQDFAVVREKIQLSLKEGVNQVAFSEVTALLEPASVILRDPSEKLDISVMEQNYRNDPVSVDSMLRYFEGKEIDFQRTTAEGELKTLRGKVIRAPFAGGGTSGSSIIEVDGKLQFDLPGRPLFPSLADDSILHPTLNWTLNAKGDVSSALELSYISGGLKWKADYNLVFPEKGNEVTMVGWITMENQSGRTFKEANIKLLAGDVQRVQPNVRQRQLPVVTASAMRMDMDMQVTEKAFDEYHLYSLPRPTTLRDRETKQVEFLHSEKVQAQTLYIYNGNGMHWDWQQWNGGGIRDDRAFGIQSNKKVWIYREFKNSKENGLGVPLPKGMVRFYRQDDDERLEFIGESKIDHTPKDETLKLYTGDAFDLVGERTQTDFKVDTSRKTLIESFKISVRNRKKEPVTIRVTETLYRGATWEITEASEKFEKIDSRTIVFPVLVAPDEEREVTYTVKYTW